MDGKASIIIVTYNSRKDIDACLGSIIEEGGYKEIIVVDNVSSDGTADHVEKNYPSVKLVRNKVNSGYGAGNNLGASLAKGEFLVIINPDTKVEKDWLKELLEPFKTEKKMVTTPKILLFDGTKINTCGNVNHFTGLTFTRYYLDDREEHNRSEYVTGISGACFAIRRDEFIKMGMFDKDLFLYNEDSELSWRLNALDYKVKYVPSSVIRHNYTLKVSPEKIFHLERGRYLIIRKYLSPWRRFLLLPSLFTAEKLTWGYSLKKGPRGLMKKINAYKGLFLKRKKMYLDRERLRRLSVTIPTEQLSSNWFEVFVKRVANLIFRVNMKVVG